MNTYIGERKTMKEIVLPVGNQKCNKGINYCWNLTLFSGAFYVVTCKQIIKK